MYYSFWNNLLKIKKVGTQYMYSSSVCKITNQTLHFSYMYYSFWNNLLKIKKVGTQYMYSSSVCKITNQTLQYILLQK